MRGRPGPRGEVVAADSVVVPMRSAGSVVRAFSPPSYRVRVDAFYEQLNEPDALYEPKPFSYYGAEVVLSNDFHDWHGPFVSMSYSKRQIDDKHAAVVYYSHEALPEVWYAGFMVGNSLDLSAGYSVTIHATELLAFRAAFAVGGSRFAYSDSNFYNDGVTPVMDDSDRVWWGLLLQPSLDAMVFHQSPTGVFFGLAYTFSPFEHEYRYLSRGGAYDEPFRRIRGRGGVVLYF